MVRTPVRLAQFCDVPPAGFEPALPPPEGGALSPELRGLATHRGARDPPKTSRAPGPAARGTALPAELGQELLHACHVAGLCQPHRLGQAAYLVPVRELQDRLDHVQPAQVVADHQLAEQDVGLVAGRLAQLVERSEERRVGKECRSRWSTY